MFLHYVTTLNNFELKQTYSNSLQASVFNLNLRKGELSSFLIYDSKVRV